MTEKFSSYLHGQSKQEEERLREQALFLEQDIFEKVDFSKSSHILEIGCGVGAQTELLLKHFPHLHITAIDHHPSQIERAQAHFSGLPQRENTQFLEESAESLSFQKESFDGAFICWLLEHVSSPLKVLQEVRRVLKSGSLVICTEVMNHSLFLWPKSPAIEEYWRVYNLHQLSLGGDPQIGAKIGNLLGEAGFKNILVRPLFYLLDSRNSQRRNDLFDYWLQLLLSASSSLVREKKVTQEQVEELSKEMAALKQHPKSIFSYTSLQASCQA